jgi:hypothetical protein
MDDFCLLLLILIIIVACLIILGYEPDLGGVSAGPVVIGGALAGLAQSADDPGDKPGRELFIGDQEVLIVDGHNMIHQYAGPHLSVLEFERTLKNISAMLLLAYPTQKLHIVLKNPKASTARLYSKVKRTPTSKGERNSRVKAVPYFQELVKISRGFPTITYHLAYQKDTNKKTAKKSPRKHSSKGRDDFLTIWLSTRHPGAYVLSQDRFRDFKEFASIKSFTHYSVKRLIKPLTTHRSLVRPNLGNHYLFKFISASEARSRQIKNGAIYKNPDESAFGCMYVIRPDP